MAMIQVEVGDKDLMVERSSEQVRYYQLTTSVDGFDVACEIVSLDGVPTYYLGHFDSSDVFVYGMVCDDAFLAEMEAEMEADKEDYIVTTSGDRKGELGVVVNEVKRDGKVVSYVVEFSDDVIMTIDVDHAVRIKD